MSIFIKIRKALAVLLFVGLFGSSCATVSRLNAEYKEATTEETARVAMMSPAGKAEWQRTEREREKLNWNEYLNGDNN
jgi:hypothetical protein